MPLITIVLTYFIAVAPIGVSLSELNLEILPNQYVEVKGFAYKKPDGDWILSDEPQLKSCCVGSFSKADSQVHFQTSSDLPKEQVIIVQGNLRLEGNRYYLENSNVIIPDNFPSNTLSIAAILLIFSVILLKFVRNLRKNEIK